MVQFGVIGGGSWATALVKILTDNKASVNWWVRNETVVQHIQSRHHNPQYLSSVYFNINHLKLTNDLEKLIRDSDCIVIAIPSAFIEQIFQQLPREIFEDKIILSAVKGILPEKNLLLNDLNIEKLSFTIIFFY